MNKNNYAETHGPSLGQVAAEIKQEIKEFGQTRLQMFKAELKEKITAWKAGALLAAVGLLFLGTAYLLLTLALVGLVAVAFWGSAYAWFLAFLIVGVFWALVGGIVAFMAVREFRAQGVAPRRTIEVLKRDKIWLQEEARGQI
ncbi:MAG TPA: phage holin family protein [Terriglobales bacterium]|nr:phage holin family protein [Terriglobales bacterium]